MPAFSNLYPNTNFTLTPPGPHIRKAGPSGPAAILDEQTINLVQ